MTVKFDGKIDISIGHGKDSKIWKNKKWEWSTIVDRIKSPTLSPVSYKEYLAASKEDKSTIKNNGAYVGGYLRNGRRLKSNVMHRQLLTLDLDFAPLDIVESLKRKLPYSFIIHTTFSHSETNPRFRLLIPLTREVSTEEYYAVSRMVAGIVDIEIFDDTTFDVNRLMYWSSHPYDSPFMEYFQDSPWADPDEILAIYPDWKDVSLWPVSSRVGEFLERDLKKQQDPLEKKGIVGAWCRTFSIRDAISEFLGNCYTETVDGRYTYVNSSTSSGLVVYEDKFAYSFHGTDPASGLLCNSFDLVRIHKFGHLDDKDYQESPGKMKSFLAMEDFALSQKSVKLLLVKEQVESSRIDFSEDESEEDNIEPEDSDWLTLLETERSGKIVSSANNLTIIFENDRKVKGKFKLNVFDNRPYVFGPVPWRKSVSKDGEPLKNVDFSGIRNYLEVSYSITGTQKIEDILNLEMEKNSYNPVMEYLSSLEWDKVKRIDTLLIKYFSVPDTLYNREAIRKPLVAAVARIFEPGTKFDLVLTLVGVEGNGKSSFFKKLGKQWFSDTFLTVVGKEALEQIQGAWLIEIAELAGLKKAEVETIKHFITKQEDMFRPAYARTVETYKRQCIFFGTTNNKDFLRDPTGNRRFLPVSVSPYALGGMTPGFDQEIDQIWAEAVYLYFRGETLYLSKEANQFADYERKAHSESDLRTGIVREYLDMLLPEGWGDMDIHARREYISDPLSKKGKYERDYVCIAELWCECLGKEKNEMSRYNTRDLNEIIRTFPEWEPATSTKRFKIYGTQKFFQKRLD